MVGPAVVRAGAVGVVPRAAVLAAGRVGVGVATVASRRCALIGTDACRCRIALRHPS